MHCYASYVLSCVFDLHVRIFDFDGLARLAIMSLFVVCMCKPQAQLFMCVPLCQLFQAYLQNTHSPFVFYCKLYYYDLHRLSGCVCTSLFHCFKSFDKSCKCVLFKRVFDIERIDTWLCVGLPFV